MPPPCHHRSCLATRSHPYAPTPITTAVELVGQLVLQPRPPRHCPLAAAIEAATAILPEERLPIAELLAMVRQQVEIAASSAVAAQKPRQPQRGPAQTEPRATIV